jgi:hypothetical protein
MLSIPSFSWSCIESDTLALRPGWLNASPNAAVEATTTAPSRKRSTPMNASAASSRRTRMFTEHDYTKDGTVAANDDVDGKPNAT